MQSMQGGSEPFRVGRALCVHSDVRRVRDLLAADFGRDVGVRVHRLVGLHPAVLSFIIHRRHQGNGARGGPVEDCGLQPFGHAISGDGEVDGTCSVWQHLSISILR